MGLSRLVVFSTLFFFSTVSLADSTDEDRAESVISILFSKTYENPKPNGSSFQSYLAEKSETKRWLVSRRIVESKKTKVHNRIDLNGQPFTSVYHTGRYDEVDGVIRQFDRAYPLFLKIRRFGLSIFDAWKLLGYFETYEKYLDERARGIFTREMTAMGPQGVSFETNDPESIMGLIRGYILHAIRMQRLSYRIKWRANSVVQFCSDHLSLIKMAFGP